MSEHISNSEPRENASQPAPRKKRRKRRSGLGMVGKVLGTILLVILCTGVLLVGIAAVYIKTVIIPEAQKQQDGIGDISVNLTSTMYYTDENGVDQPYLTISSDENRVWVSYSDMPEDLINAVVAIEDKRFWTHGGVDWIRTGKSVINMFTGGSIQGGSTITQQLIKNSTGKNQVTVKRKVTEIFTALEFEKNHSKEQILEYYLNLVFFGERSYGVGAASYAYFGKDVRELSLAQCASLVGITNNPSRYDPYLNKDKEVTNDEANRKRAKLVLGNMLDQGMIDEETYNAACDEVDTMEFVMGSVEGGGVTTVYNWYQEQVITDVVNDLMEEYGWSSQVASNKIYYGGLSIYTNVDVRVQEIVDSVYSDADNLPYVSNSGQQLQSSIVIIDNSGKVVALSGGIGEKTKNRVWNRASATLRPAGSSIKPLAVYAPAVEMGYINPNTVLDDAPYQILNDNVWPANANRYYNGLVTVRKALASSLNTCSVRVLGDFVTPETSYKFLEEKFHITSLVREKWINNHKYSDMDLAPLALGGLTEGVSTYEMAAAFATFPSMGKYVAPTTYSKVVDANGNVLLQNSGEGEYVLKESTAYYMNSMLTDVVTSGTGGSAAFSGMTIAGKTGTTTSKKDVWFCGYTPYYTAAVWVGYDRQELLSGVGYPHTALWKQVMSQVHEGLERKSFPTPSNAEVVTAYYCQDCGKIPTEACEQDVRGSRVATGYYIDGDQPTETCTCHVAVRVCTADPILDESGAATGQYHVAGPYCPEETIKTVSYVDYVREGAAAEVETRDSDAMLCNYDLEDTCHVHLSANFGHGDDENSDFDPNNPDTWPIQDPDFDINNPNTWPVMPMPGDTENGGESDDFEQDDYVPAGIPRD